MRLSKRVVAPTTNKTGLSQSSIPSLAYRRYIPRSLELVVRRVVTSLTCGHPISKPAVRPLSSKPILAQAPRVHRQPERQPFASARTQMPRQQLQQSKQSGSPNPATYRVVPSPIHSVLQETSISIRESRVYLQTSSNDEVEQRAVAQRSRFISVIDPLLRSPKTRPAIAPTDC